MKIEKIKKAICDFADQSERVGGNWEEMKYKEKENEIIEKVGKLGNSG